MKLVGLLLITVYACLFQGCCSLRSLSITLPEMVKSGEDVTLRCDYDLEQDALYAIKWYMDSREFFRFVPKESPPFMAFNSPFLSVDLSKSGPTQVTLSNVKRRSTGTYGCEVSADFPSFHTDHKSAHMTVAVLPTVNPSMEVEMNVSNTVEIGTTLQASCNSSPSFPVTDLTWFLNDEEVQSSSPEIRVESRIELENIDDGMQKKLSTILITLNDTHFGDDGFMELKCFASIGDLWNWTDSARLKVSTPSIASPVFEFTSSRTYDGKTASLDRPNSGCSRVQFFATFLQAIVVLLLCVR